MIFLVKATNFEETLENCMPDFSCGCDDLHCACDDLTCACDDFCGVDK